MASNPEIIVSDYIPKDAIAFVTPKGIGYVSHRTGVLKCKCGRAVFRPAIYKDGEGEPRVHLFCECGEELDG